MSKAVCCSYFRAPGFPPVGVPVYHSPLAKIVDQFCNDAFMGYPWKKLNTNYSSTLLFQTGIALMCSPVITILFRDQMTIWLIVCAGLVMAILGMLMGLSA